VTPCLRCGAFAAAYPIDGLALCAACLGPRGTPPPGKAALRPPLDVVLLKALVVVSLLTTALGLLLAGIQAGAILAAALALAFIRIELFRGRWKRRLIRELGLAALPRGQILILVAHARTRPEDVDDVGLLTWSTGSGFAFIGRSGGIAFPHADLRLVRVDFDAWREPRWTLRLERSSGEVHVFRFLGTEAQIVAKFLRKASRAAGK
jgi:hypothetical protein